MNYEDMSDLEINKAVACRLGLRFFIKPNSNGNQTEDWVYGGIGSPNEMTELADYCNSWADMGSIIEREKIGGHFGKATPNLYFALSRDENNICTHVNPLRAAAIVYLMMEVK